MMHLTEEYTLPELLGLQRNSFRMQFMGNSGEFLLTRESFTTDFVEMETKDCLTFFLNPSYKTSQHKGTLSSGPTGKTHQQRENLKVSGFEGRSFSNYRDCPKLTDVDLTTHTGNEWKTINFLLRLVATFVFCGLQVLCLDFHKESLHKAIVVRGNQMEKFYEIV